MIHSSRRFHVYILLLVIFLLLVVPLVAISLMKNSRDQQASVINSQINLAIKQDGAAVNFSDLEEWDQTLIKDYSGESTKFFSPISKEAINTIQLPPPPSSNSEKTKNEVQDLILLSNLRLANVVQEIKKENDLNEAVFAHTTINKMKMSHPQTVELLQYSNQQLTPVIIHFKQKFDRVRPTVLAPSLNVILETQTQPSYPSEYSSRAYLVANVLGLLDPKNEMSYFASAKRISHNREIAGINYESDSEIGKLLAEEFFNLLVQDKGFTELLESARTEW